MVRISGQDTHTQTHTQKFEILHFFKFFRCKSKNNWPYVFGDCAFHFDRFAIDFVILSKEHIFSIFSIAENDKTKTTRALRVWLQDDLEYFRKSEITDSLPWRPLRCPALKSSPSDRSLEFSSATHR